MQVRDSDGVTIYVGIMTGTIEAGQTGDVSTLWTVPPGESYEVIVFILSSLEGPQILSDAHSSTLGVA